MQNLLVFGIMMIRAACVHPTDRVVDPLGTSWSSLSVASGTGVKKRRKSGSGRRAILNVSVY